MDVETLLQKHTLDELKEVEKKLRTEVERKKEELRELVSLRYRDLIDAADKIKGMHTSIASVTTQLKSLKLRSVPPSSSQAVGQSFSSAQELRSQNLEAVSRLLFITPELIFRLLDSADPLTASFLFAFARNVAWQWNETSTTQHPQWTFLRMYGDFIDNSVQLLFEKITYQPRELGSYFGTVMVLNNTTTKYDTLTAFLAKRSRVLHQLLTASSTLSVRDTIQLSFSCIWATLRGIHEIFFAENFFGFLQSKSGDAKEKLFSGHLHSENFERCDDFVSLFDGIVSSLVLSAHAEGTRNVQNPVRVWIVEVLALTGMSLKTLLECVPSVQSVLDIRRTVDRVVDEESRRSPSLKKIAKDLDIQHGDIIAIYDAATRARFSGLISDRVLEVLQETENRLRMTAVAHDDTLGIASVFVPSTTGVAPGGIQSSSRARFPGMTTKQAFISRLSTSGVESVGASVVDFFRAELNKLWKDVRNISGPDDTDEHWILDEITTAYAGCLRKLGETVLRMSEEEIFATNSESLRILCRFLRSVTFRKTTLIDDNIPFINREVLQVALTKDVGSCSDVVFNKWLTKILDSWKEAFLTQLQANMDVVTWSLNMTPFQNNFVEEKGDTEEVVQYSLSCPVKASTVLHNSLKALHDQLVAFGGSLQFDLIINQCFSAMVACYEEHSQNLSGLRKNQALQLIFDVKLLQVLGRGRKVFLLTLTKRFQAMIDVVAAFVDPIDYHVCLPYIDQNVALHLAVVRNLYFSLAGLESLSVNLPSANLLNSDANVKAAPPSVIQLKSVWFSQLPMTGMPQKK